VAVAGLTDELFAVDEAFGFVRAETKAMVGKTKIINATLNQRILSCFFDMDVLEDSLFRRNTLTA